MKCYATYWRGVLPSGHNNACVVFGLLLKITEDTSVIDLNWQFMLSFDKQTM